jgi:hypothetical protein
MPYHVREVPIMSSDRINCGPYTPRERPHRPTKTPETISLIRKKSDTTQFLWVTIGPTYKLTTGKLSVQYALFTYLSICSSWFFNFEYSN